MNKTPLPNGNLSGPTLSQYLETRFDLLTNAIEKLEESINEKLLALKSAGVEREKFLLSEIAHTKDLLQNAQRLYERHADKIENTQALHVVELNKLAGKDELERLDRSFEAYRLEVSTIMAAANAERRTNKELSKETRDESKAWIAIVIAAAGLVITIITTFLFRQ